METKDSIRKYLADGKKRGKKLDHYRMLKDISNLVETDFVASMEMNLLLNSKTGKLYPFTQEEAQEMSALLSQVYSIAHCITCHACQAKYLKD